MCTSFLFKAIKCSRSGPLDIVLACVIWRCWNALRDPGEPKVRVTEGALVLSLAEYLSEHYLEDTECPWATLFSI